MGGEAPPVSGTTDRRPSLCWEIFRCVDCGHYYGMIAVDFEHDPNFRPVPLATTAHGARARRHARRAARVAGAVVQWGDPRRSQLLFDTARPPHRLAG